jgi:integrase
MRRRFQSGCIFKRGKRRKVWIGRWREPQKMADGFIRRVMRAEVLGAVSEMSKTKARELLTAKLSLLNAGAVAPISARTFGAFALEWEKTALCFYRPSTRKFYKTVLDRWVLPYWSEWRLAEIKLVDVRRWLTSHAATYSTSVVKHMRATLSKILADAVEAGELPGNPAKGFRTPHGKMIRRAVTLSPEHVTLALEWLQEPLRTAVRLVSILGMRESELAGLRVCDLDFSGKTIAVRQSRYRGEVAETKTEGSTRLLPMPASVESSLRMLAEVGADSDTLLFRTSTGRALNFDNVTRDVFRPVADAAGIPHFTWRSFRRTASTQMHRNGTPVRVAQSLLGHANPQVTLGIYTETSLEDMRSAVTGLEASLFSSVPKLQTELQVARVN